MLNPLTDHDLARLHAKFVVPIVVDQILKDEEPLDDIAEHAINEILFELCPDTALLCLAMCARHVAEATANLPISRALANQCDQIIEEYGPLWLAHEQNPQGLDNKTIKELLSFIPEDLEALRDLLDATLAALEEDHCLAAILCDILSFQADHHSGLAEIELQNINVRPQSRPVVELAKKHGDNVIPFPLAIRAARQLIRN
jgi:hypothetical protein